MAGNRGLYILPDGSSNGTTPLNARLALSGLIAGTGAAALSIRSGVFYDGIGNVVGGNTDTGTMSYSVRAAVFALPLLGVASSGAVVAVNDAPLKVTTTAAPGSNSRIDVIWVRQHAVASDGGPDADNIFQIGVTQGTAAASPTVPAIPTGAMALTQAVMTSGSVSTNALAYTHVHGWTASAGSPIPVRTQTERDALTGYDGLTVYRIDNNVFETHDGTAWNGSHRPRRLLIRLATFSLLNNTNTAVGSWTADTGDDGDTVISYSNPTLTVNRPGRYRVRFLMVFPANATGARTVALYKNPTLSGGTVTGGNAFAINTLPGAAGGAQSLEVDADIVLATSDVLVAATSQTSGGTMTTGSATPGFVLWQVTLEDPS